MILRLQRYDPDVRYKKGSELYLADTLSQHYPKFEEATQDQREHVLLATSAFEEGLDVEQDVQEINHLLVNKHEEEMLRVEASEIALQPSRNRINAEARQRNNLLA